MLFTRRPPPGGGHGVGAVAWSYPVVTPIRKNRSVFASLVATKSGPPESPGPVELVGLAASWMASMDWSYCPLGAFRSP